jgi:hypothetical protein
MNNFMKSLVLVVLLAFMGSASAGMTVKEYEKFKNDDFMKMYIYGVGVGYSWANAELLTLKRPLLYCAPETLVLHGENYIQILNQRIEAVRRIAGDEVLSEYYIEIMLKDGLKQAFPCVVK